jgi:hypothetical protein
MRRFVSSFSHSDRKREQMPRFIPRQKEEKQSFKLLIPLSCSAPFENFNRHSLFYSQIHFLFEHFFDVKRIHVSIVPELLKWSQLKFVFPFVTLQRMRVSTRKRNTFARRWKKMFVIGVLVVGGCYRRVLQSSFAHINVDMLPVAFLVLRLLSTDQFHPFRLAYSGGINNTRRMLAFPTLIALSFVAFFASAGT